MLLKDKCCDNAHRLWRLVTRGGLEPPTLQDTCSFLSKIFVLLYVSFGSSQLNYLATKNFVLPEWGGQSGIRDSNPLLSMRVSNYTNSATRVFIFRPSYAVCRSSRLSIYIATNSLIKVKNCVVLCVHISPLITLRFPLT